MTTQQPEAQMLIDWFEESGGFSQGTKAPHKWVLQAEQELRRQHARIVELEAELTAATHNTQQGLDSYKQRNADIGKAVMRACKQLPEGAEIQIYLERGAGTVHMTDWDGNEFDHFDQDHEDFACRINAATDGAIAAEKVAAQAKKGEQP